MQMVMSQKSYADGDVTKELCIWYVTEELC